MLISRDTPSNRIQIYLYFYPKCSGLPVLPFIQGRLYSSAFCKEFDIHYSHHIYERTWNAFFFHTYFSTTGDNKFSVSWFPFCKGFHIRDSFAKCSVDEWMDGWTDKFAAVEFSDKGNDCFLSVQWHYIVVSRRTFVSCIPQSSKTTMKFQRS